MGLSLKQIVSGGQSGVDRAALDAAREQGIAIGGWCPAGHWAEDGPIADEYPLRETPSTDPAQRTAWNVRDSDGTLILTIGALTGGTALTRRLCTELGRPCLVIDLSDTPDPHQVSDWLARQAIKVLNVAGPRLSSRLDIYERAHTFLRSCLSVVAPE
ncbi:putative molybdenum carrier protein [Gloeobacter kilaueensis]|uniref:Molybdenum carrier n=1 Tax=Gloeobacter kilaueensis (strain ATCC BAA-2537 / CCAP 1431/1 / ULC 316 / JS1) TaxID=1183438 RepID=U5QJG1_GLOK1|nr:putative molybdenum carrier protein [Gloeobacter kilaueensis]AGY59013.1 hypothetical protein GKIL_2767 [Gloeobacter kilaueensis JS1]